MDRIMDKKQPHPLFKLATELGPLLIFFFANAKANLFVATGAFMVAVVAAAVQRPETHLEFARDGGGRSRHQAQARPRDAR